MPVIKKTMRVTQAYFHNFEGSRDEDLLSDLHKNFQARFQAWESLAVNHPNLAALYSVSPMELTLFQEYYGNGDLREHLKRGVSEASFFRIVTDILRGVAHLHNHDPPIAHGYINPGKIYIKGDTAVLGEFGLSQLVSDFPHLVPSISVTGLTRWMSPEYFNGSQPGVFTTQGDMWSVGCTLFEVSTGFLPYHQSKYDNQVLAKVMDNVLPGNLESVPYHGLSRASAQVMQRLITECWSPFGRRPSSQVVLEQLKQGLEPSIAWNPVATPPQISAKMTVLEIFSVLIYHGIKDVTSRLDFGSIREEPVSGGGYGIILIGYLNNGTKVALKIPHDSPDLSNKRFDLIAARELYTWSRCDHRNILSLIGATMYKGRIALITPWIERGDLSQYLHKSPVVPGVDRLGICVQITEGLSYLHSIGIIYNDMKGLNILISDNMTAQLCDFGEAVFVNPNNGPQFDVEVNVGHALHWTAPEIFKGEVQGTVESDIYSLGMTILEIITGDLPWADAKNYVTIISRVTNGKRPKRPEVFLPLEDEWANLTWDLLTRCWDQEPERRPTAAEVRDRLKDIIAKT